MPTEDRAPATADRSPSCPACGGALHDWRSATAADAALAGATAYRLERCQSCGTAVTVGPPAAPALYEGGAYAPTRPLADRLLAPLRRLIERDKLRFVAALEPGSRVVEVGAGDGSFVAAMRAGGLDAVGYEPSASAVEAATRRGAPVARAALEDADPGGSVDAVVAWHVLEHVEEPAAALERASGWLRPGGTLVVACPNLAGLQARIGGDRWFHQDVPRHRTHFTAAGLTKLVERTGHSVERVSHVLIEQNPFGMWQTLLNRLTAERDLAFRLLKGGSRARVAPRDLVVTIALGALLAPVAVVGELAAGVARRGGSVVVVARRS